MKGLVSRLSLVAMTFVIAACATTPQQAIPLQNQVWQRNADKVILVVKQTPEPTFSTPGAGCLLCIGVARAAHGSLIEQVESWSPDELNTLESSLRLQLEQLGLTVQTVSWEDIKELPGYGGSEPNAADKDFSEFARENGASHIVVLKVDSQGVSRNYASYVPTGDPTAKIVGQAYLVSVESNLYEWYQPIETNVKARGEWDEPPNFPGLTNAYFQAIEMVKGDILRPFQSQTAQY